MRFTRRAMVALCGAAGLTLTGCATRVTTGPAVPPVPTAGPPPRPGTVFVYDFGIDWQTIQLDQGFRARLERAAGNPAAQQQQIATEVQEAISSTLLDQITGMGLHASPDLPLSPPGLGDVVIRGQITRVEAGNATRRRLIGFGAGKSEVFANVRVYQVAAGGGLQPLQTYDAEANSGRAPGMGLGAASSAAGHTALAASSAVVGTANRAREGLPRDAQHLANRVATNLGRLFTRLGWIPESAIPPPSL